MLRKTGIVLCCAAFFFLVGGHWAVLQTAAWTKMILSYSKSDPLAVAVEKTFDGEHPCDDCRSIQSAKKQEEEKSAPSFKSEKKVETLAGAPQAVLKGPLPSSICLPSNTKGGGSRMDAPPVPPPRSIGA